MARYDRIAPLPLPSRDVAFPGWSVLRDIEGNDRDADAARRARLRFIALRPALRLARRGSAGVGRDSHRAQIQGVREELGYLPARDVERLRLSRFLQQLEDAEAVRVMAALLEMADAYIAAGQSFCAEEYARTALDFAETAAQPGLESRARTIRARCYRVRGELDQAEQCAEEAERIAQAAGETSDAVYARSERALAAAARGTRNAGELLVRSVAQAREANDRQAEALATAKLCACELALGNPAAALEYGWNALRQLDDLRERALLLEQVGGAFALLGMNRAAERCFTMIAQRGVDPTLRARARAAQAVNAAANGATQVFLDRRLALLNDAVEWAADPRVAAFVHVELARGCVLAEDADTARAHLAEAITTARAYPHAGIPAHVEEVLGALHGSAPRVAETPRGTPAAEVVRRIAEQLEALPDLPLIPA